MRNGTRSLNEYFSTSSFFLHLFFCNKVHEDDNTLCPKTVLHIKYGLLERPSKSLHGTSRNLFATLLKICKILTLSFFQ